MVRKFPAAGTPSFRARRSGRGIIPSKLLTKSVAPPSAPKESGDNFSGICSGGADYGKAALGAGGEDDTYAANGFYKDLERAKLYADTDRKMKS